MGTLFEIGGGIVDAVLCRKNRHNIFPNLALHKQQTLTFDHSNTPNTGLEAGAWYIVRPLILNYRR